MTTLSFYLNVNPLSSSSSSHLSPVHLRGRNIFRIVKKRKKRRDFGVFSVHSNARILKTNRKSAYGQRLSPYDSSDEEEEDYWSSDDESAEVDEFDGDIHSNRKPSSLNINNTEQGTALLTKLAEEEKTSLLTEPKVKITYSSNIPERRHAGVVYHSKSGFKNMDCVNTSGTEKLKNEKSMKNQLCKLSEDLDFDEKWFPLIDYLSTFGLKESHFIQIYERHMPCLQINVASAKERLEFLLSVGVKHTDIRRILLRQPQILEYTVENNMKSHVAFLTSLGVPDSRIGQIITAAPSLFSYSVDQSLKPTVRYLVEEVGIKRNDVSKVVQLSPQILVQRINISWTSRFGFLSKELGAPRDSIVKMVTKHPQLLHYSIEDGILPRINFLRSIGMQNSDILKVLTSLTQVLSLSLEDNLKPKYLYLVNELHNEVHSLTKYPMYLSLSLEQRIQPRHRFLVALKKAPKGPFPLSALVPTDECFCQQWAGTSLDKYLAFKQSLLLSQFARKYGRK